jgi:hypothetical protein
VSRQQCSIIHSNIFVMILVITWLYIGSYTILLVTLFFFLSHVYRALVVDTTVDLFASGN